MESVPPIINSTTELISHNESMPRVLKMVKLWALNTLQKNNSENSKQIFPEKELRGQFPHSCVCERFINSHDRSSHSTAGKYVDLSWECITHRHMNVEIGTEAAQFPEKQYIYGILVAVYVNTFVITTFICSWRTWWWRTPPPRTSWSLLWTRRRPWTRLSGSWPTSSKTTFLYIFFPARFSHFFPPILAEKGKTSFIKGLAATF